MENNTRNSKALRRHKRFVTCCSVVLVISITVFCLAVGGIVGILNESGSKDKNNSSGFSQSGSNSQQGSDNKGKVKKVASATVVNTGDILIHNPVLNGAKDSSGKYDFSALFKPVSSYFKDADLAVANLELSLGGTKSGDYKGYPAFNTPDELIDDLIDANVSFLLTANNHCYDTGLYGLTRTVQVLKEKKIDYTGTRETANEPRYVIKDVNGIKIGMVCYTYSAVNDSSRVSINGATIKKEAEPLINTFAYDKLDAFYTDAQNLINDMKAKGADCTVFYMHWGDEYRLKPNEYQKTMAQKLCNMGVDVIVGGHPHVIEPMELLQAEGGDHTTVCLYSMGNSVSNQRREELTGLCNTGHTEDGLLFYYTFDKYSDGTTVLASVDVIPVWVDKVGQRYNAKYSMYPLENENDGAQKHSLSSASAAKAKESYKRTKDIIEPGLSECQRALGCEVRFGRIK